MVVWYFLELEFVKEERICIFSQHRFWVKQPCFSYWNLKKTRRLPNDDFFIGPMAADLDWIVGPGYSLGGYILGCSQRLALCLRHSARIGPDLLYRPPFVIRRPSSVICRPCTFLCVFFGLGHNSIMAIFKIGHVMSDSGLGWQSFCQSDDLVCAH